MKQFWIRQRLPATTLILLHVVILLAGFLGPYDPTMQNRRRALSPPMAVHFFDERGVFHVRPQLAAGDGDQRYPLRFLCYGAPYRLLGLWTLRTHLFGVDEPGRVFLLGSDEFGRDQLSRILWGGQISLLTGWLAAILTLGIGLALGSAAGFFGGWRDAIIMRGVDLFLALPWIYLLLAVRAFLPLSLSQVAAQLVLVGLIGAVGWARPARLIRGIVLSAKERDYVYAARGFGASSWHLLTRHCLPETYRVLATQAALLIPQYILAEVTLSFLGLGIAEPAASWGTLLAPFRQVSLLASSWWLAMPALVVMITSWCFLTLEDSFADGNRTK
jgi:peptide/nickel transport system permease protein